MTGARGWPWGVLVALLALEGLLGVYGIDQPVRWGHQGYHVAEHGLGARNLLRHGTWDFTTFHGEGEPTPSDLEFHHPVMLQVPVAAVQALFGESPWTARVVGLLLSFAGLAGLAAFWRRARDERRALVATGFFVLSPMHVAFANLPDVQILGITAMCWWGALLLRFRARPTRGGAAALVLLAAAGALSDWAWHPVFWLTVVLLGWRAHGGTDALGEEQARLLRRTLLLMAVVAGLALAQHFARAMAAGRLDDLQAAYVGRAARPPVVSFLTFAGRRLLHHHTLPVLLGAAGWLVHAVLRRRDDPASLLVAAWLVAQVVYIFNFPNEFELHEYRSYWLVVPFACAMADLVHALERRLGSASPRLARALPVLVLALLSTRTIPMWIHSRVVSGCTSARTHDPQEALMTSSLLARAWAPPGTPVLVGAEPGQRLEVHWLLDRPSWTPETTGDVARLVERFGAVTLLDEGAALALSPEWRSALRSAAVLLVDDVALAVFRRGGTASVEHVHHRTGRRWGPVLAFLRAPVQGPPCLAPGDPAIAARFAQELGLPAPVITRARAGRAQLTRALPASLRCDAP
jgi:hypothetical protein